jgi:riboflavin kinase/FMN adenylyltransferase
MQIAHGLDGLRQLPPGAALSIGNFDGVHVGHAAIVRRLGELAPGGAIAVATFEPHPLTVLRPHLAPPRLTPAPVKRRLLASLGVTHLVELPPTPEVLNVSAEEFWRILRDDVRPAHLVEGPTFNFGRGRGGNVGKLIEWSRGGAVGVHILRPKETALLDCSLVEISSSLIRFLVANGRVRDAGLCLDRPYTLVGRVVHGFHRGRELGTPTANLQIDNQLIPADGVYAGRCVVTGQPYPAAVSIGSNPTFGDPQIQVEAHLLDFSGDLYGQTIEVELLDWIRDQRRYAGAELLIRQIRADVAQTRRVAARPPGRPPAYA